MELPESIGPGHKVCRTPLGQEFWSFTLPPSNFSLPSRKFRPRNPDMIKLKLRFPIQTRHNSPIFNECQAQSACIGFGTAMKMGSSRRFTQYPTTYKKVVWYRLHCLGEPIFIAVSKPLLTSLAFILDWRVVYRYLFS